MKTTHRHVLVFVTVPNRRAARKIAVAVLEARAAACVNVLPGVESHYVWQGQRERTAELLLVLKTTKTRLTELERVVHAHHPYDTPEFVVATITAGSSRYLAWLDESTQRANL